jgi:hypothetical protein
MDRTKKPDTDEKLRSETEKWLARLEEKMAGTRLVKGSLESKVLGNAMENVNAYIKDCHHFLENKDYFNAFEAVIYAYGIYETLERMNLLEKK